jgi:hypothetical protein
MKRLLTSLLMALVLVSCNAGNQKPTAAPTAAAPAATSAPANTAIPATSTVTVTVIPSPTSVPSATATLPPQNYGPANFPADVNPLTGLKVSDPKVLERRPMGVKINIVPRTTTRPPFGLTFADIVFDYYHNDGYSRYHAIFLDQDSDLVGPIRSGRLPDDIFIRMFKSIFVYGGADEHIDQRFLNADYANRLMRGGFDAPPCPPTAANPMCTFEPNGRHNLVASMPGLRDVATQKGINNGRQNLDGMTFQPNPPAGGKTGTQLYVRYSGDNYNRWDFDATTRRYMLFQDDVYDQGQGEKYAPLIDSVSNKQVGAENVVILVAPHEYVRRPPAEIVDIMLSGTGTAYAYRDGQMYQVTWNRPTVDAVLYLTFPDGSRYAYKPGKTWYQIIGKTSEITTQDDGAVRYKFMFP